MNKIVRIESITQMHDALGLAKPKHPLISLLPIKEVLADYDYGEFSYVMAMYQISLKSGIKGTMEYGRKSYDFQEGSLVFTKPDQALGFIDNESMEGVSGWTLVFHPDLIRRSDLGKTIDQYSFFDYETNEALHLSDDEKISVTELVKKIELEYCQNIDRHSQKLIISNLVLLLDYCTRYYDRQFYMRSDINKEIVTRFQDALDDYYDSDKPYELGLPTVKYSGSALNMSSHYLSDLLKKESGLNAQQYIQNYMIERAKTRLLTTNDQIGRIAYDLGFEYPQHFSKLFKAKTGLSPARFRAGT